MESKVGPQHVRDQVDHRLVLSECPELRVAIDGLPQPPDDRLVGGVIGRQVELVVRCGERARRLDLRGHDGAQPLEPRGTDVAGQGQKAVLEVPLARPLVEHQRRTLQHTLGSHRALLLGFGGLIR